MAIQGAHPSSTVPTHRVAVLADVRLYREGLARALEVSPLLEVVGAAALGLPAQELLAARRPDIVLLEGASARVPAVVGAVLGWAPSAKVVAFGTVDEEVDPVQFVEAGVAGYVSHEASIEDVVRVIVDVARGEFPCSAHVASLLARRISGLAGQASSRNVASSLTGRERQILRLIDDGLSNKEIGARLGIELSTVKNHVHHILDKTRATRRAQAAAHARLLSLP
jgi:DNA-binding NarL/FixJ family response regulator